MLLWCEVPKKIEERQVLPSWHEEMRVVMVGTSDGGLNECHEPQLSRRKWKRCILTFFNSAKNYLSRSFIHLLCECLGKSLINDSDMQTLGTSLCVNDAIFKFRWFTGLYERSNLKRNIFTKILFPFLILFNICGRENFVIVQTCMLGTRTKIAQKGERTWSNIKIRIIRVETWVRLFQWGRGFTLKCWITCDYTRDASVFSII